MNTVSEQDLQTIQAQIGRVPRGVLSVETRCPAGHPQVIKVYPLLEKKNSDSMEPFPTLFWLTCPNIITQISRLEYQGWIVQLEQRLQDDEEAMKQYEQNHRQYLEERWQTLKPDDQQRIREAGWEAMYLKRGIGGIADWGHIKCLHLQYAHHLARGNIIGQWLDEALEIKPCI
jgi:hypothetical protein